MIEHEIGTEFIGRNAWRNTRLFRVSVCVRMGQVSRGTEHLGSFPGRF